MTEWLPLCWPSAITLVMNGYVVQGGPLDNMKMIISAADVDAVCYLPDNIRIKAEDVTQNYEAV